MAADGRITIDTEINTNGIRAGEADMKAATTRIAGTVKKLGLVVAAAFGVKSLVNFGREAIELGSDLAEVQNVVDVTFTSMSEKVNEFAKNAATSAGLSETMAKRYAGTFGAMSKSFGFSEQAAFDMSTALTQLSGDVASFYNISQDEAYTKLKSVFTGETESLKDLGVVMTQTALDSYAMANGVGKTTSAMTEQEKVALRYRFVVDQLSGASGDFMRTSDGWANRVRIMQLQISSLKATIGQGLINVFNPILNVINIVLARLATVANAFKSFTELITGGKSGGNGNTGIASAMNNTAESYGSAAENADDYADAAEGAGKASKEAGKEAEGALASFDKLNVESDQSGGGAGGGGGGGGGGALAQAQDIDYGNLAEGEEIVDKTDGILQKLINRFIELKNLFLEGFKIGVGDLSVLDSIQNSFLSIKESLIGIFTDESVLEAANNMLNVLSFDLGRIAGSFVSVGLTIADNLVGGAAEYLSSAQERIKGFLISMFDITSEVSTITANFAVAVAEIFSVFRGDTAKQVTADIIAIFVDSFMGITELGYKLFRDLIDIILTPFTENADKIKEALENFLSPVETILKTLSDSIVEMFSEANKVYDKHLKPLFDSIRDGLSKVIGTFLDGYNKHLAPVLDKLAKKFDDIWKSTIQPLINNAIGLIGDVADLVKALWENVMQPFLNWFAANVFPVISPIIEGVGDLFLNVFDAIGKILDGFVIALRTVTQFLTGGFQSDWKSAWDTMKNKFSDMWNSLPDIVKGVVNKVIDGVESMLNGVIRGINNLISGINGIADKVPGISSDLIPSIGEIHLPRLASGTVVPPRAGEFAAILGDNNRETEVVSPLSTMKQAFLEAMAQSGGMGGGDINITLNLDGKVVYQDLIKRNRAEKKRTGANPLLV